MLNTSEHTLQYPAAVLLLQCVENLWYTYTYTQHRAIRVGKATQSSVHKCAQSILENVAGDLLDVRGWKRLSFPSTGETLPALDLA